MRRESHISNFTSQLWRSVLPEIKTRELMIVKEISAKYYTWFLQLRWKEMNTTQLMYGLWLYRIDAEE